MIRTRSVLLLGLMANCLHTPRAHADAFGSGPNAFNIQFLDVGNPGNPGDTNWSATPVGAVPYAYRIGKYEINRDMVSKANAAVASGGGNLGITLQDMTSFGGNGPARPATGVSWNEAARFVNWLNTSHGLSPAYKFTTQPGDVGYDANQNISLWSPGDAGYNASNLFRNSLAFYFLPSDDEWYKAAYYNASTGAYVNYPTGSNATPTAVASGNAAGTAVYGQPSDAGPADIALAGGLSLYGTMGQGGNVFEWEETEDDFVNDSTTAARGKRGGDWNSFFGNLAANSRSPDAPTLEVNRQGFRVASVPEPSSLVGALIGLGMLWSRKSANERRP